MSEMPPTPCRSTVSASANASVSDVLLPSTASSSLSFGMTISVSTLRRSVSMPSTAWFALRLPSKLKGYVTTPCACRNSSSKAIEQHHDLKLRMHLQVELVLAAVNNTAQVGLLLCKGVNAAPPSCCTSPQGLKLHLASPRHPCSSQILPACASGTSCMLSVASSNL